MVVVAVGMHTQFGIIKEMMLKSVAEREDTPLQVNLDGIAKCVDKCTVLILYFLFFFFFFFFY
jgi:magnesium-transporting ATPase (P-type)